MVYRVRPQRGRRYRAFVFYKHLIPSGFLNESNYAQVLIIISNTTKVQKRALFFVVLSLGTSSYFRCFSYKKKNTIIKRRSCPFRSGL